MSAASSIGRASETITAFWCLVPSPDSFSYFGSFCSTSGHCQVMLLLSCSSPPQSVRALISPFPFSTSPIAPSFPRSMVSVLLCEHEYHEANRLHPVMLRGPSLLLKAPVFCRIIDSMRQNDVYARRGIIYPIRIELGQGVDSCTPGELQDKVDALMRRSQRFATTKTGQVYNRDNTVASTIKAYKQYVLTGNMRGGYVKGDHRYGPRLTGYGGATTKPGLRWNGEDL